MLLFWGFAHNLLSLLDKLKVEPKKKIMFLLTFLAITKQLIKD